MSADGDTTRRLCDELAKQMGELISQAAAVGQGRVFPWKMVENGGFMSYGQVMESWTTIAKILI